MESVRKYIIYLLACLPVLHTSLVSKTQDLQKGNHGDYHAVRLTEPIRVDGILDEARYEIEAISDFVQNEPLNGKKPTQRTEVWVSYTETDLYISARLHDSEAGQIRAPKNRRDQMANSDQFQIAIDTYHDRRSGFFFIVNPAGSFQDGTVFNDSDFDDSWDGIWYRGVSIDDNGWNVEIRIPFSQLRFEPMEEQIMAISFGRFIDRHKEHNLDIFIPYGETGIVSRWNDLRGIRNIKPPRKIEIIPYITASRSILPSLDNHPLYNGRNSHYGLGADIKVGLGNNLTFSGTINPDFGQVEVDPSVINLSDNETFYREKRPFFIEGANIFNFGSNGPSNRMSFMYMMPDLFYSRRIGAFPGGEIVIPSMLEQKISDESHEIYTKTPGETTIIGAGKISGKLTEQWSTGIFTAVTAEEKGTGKAYFEDGSPAGAWNEVIEPASAFFIGRALGEFNAGRQGIGFMGTVVRRKIETLKLESEFTNNATTAGTDGWIFLDEKKQWVLSGFMALSSVEGSQERVLSLQESSSRYFQRPDADHIKIDSSLTKLTGYSGRLVLTKDQGNIIFNTSVAVSSPGFEPNDLGILFDTDKVHSQAVVGYSWNQPTKYFNYGNLIFAKAMRHNFDGKQTSSMNFLTGFFRFHNQSRINFIGGAGPRTLSDRALRGGPMVISPFGWFSDFSIMSDSRKRIQGSISFERGGSEKGGRNSEISTELEIRVGPQLKLEVEPSYSTSSNVSQYVTTFEDPSRTDMYGVRYIVSQLDQRTVSMELRADYSLNPDLSIQAYIQPFFAVGHYSRFKEFTKPGTYSFYEYGESQDLYNITYSETSDLYEIRPDGSGSSPYYFENPDFNYKSFIGNFVLRWEFRPGSTLYLVWTRNNENYDDPGYLKLGRDIDNLFDNRPDNHFAMKLTFWFGQ